jgi:hypothetical protein
MGRLEEKIAGVLLYWLHSFPLACLMFSGETFVLLQEQLFLVVPFPPWDPPLLACLVFIPLPCLMFSQTAQQRQATRRKGKPLRIVVIARAQKSHPLLFYSWHNFFSWQGFSLGTCDVWEKQGTLCWHLCTMSREVGKTLISSSSGKTFEQGLFQRNQYFHQWFTSQYPLT